MKIVYFGSDVFLPCFTYFLQQHQILALYTYHNDEDYFTEYAIVKLARERNIPVHYEAITPQEITRYFTEEGCELFFIAEYDRILTLPQELPSFRGVNTHSSLLPQGRSYYPIEGAMERSLARTGVTMHKVAQRLDGGEDVYGRDDLGGLLDQKYYILARRMNVGDSHFYLLACMRSSTINEYVGDMFSSFILSAGLTLLLSSVLSIVLTNRITQPLHDIGEAARRFGGGDFSARVAPSGDDEITSLAQTFNSMAVNLESIDKSRSQFMGNLAHELRTPMTSVKGFVDGMLDGTIPPEMQHHYLEIVSQETGRLARLVQNMLDITKLEAGEYKVHARSYDVWETLTGVLLANEQRVLAGKIVINDLAPVPTMVYADPDLVHQVVQNLMDNALKFTPPGGNIRFDVKRLQPGIVEVSITNTGEGISPEALPFVFQRFYKEDASRGLNAKGSGLGLHICKVLITLSGGTIRVDSKQGEWCRFTFTLPEPPAPPRQRRGGKKEG